MIEDNKKSEEREGAVRHVFYGRFPFYKQKMNNRTLFERLKEYGQSDIYPFHMPGHKRRLSPGELGKIYDMDITEIDGFDNLHDPEGILKEAQEYAAELYHSEETSFVINGSTAGILAAIAGTCTDGGTIMTARNCHKSVYHAIELHHLKPIYIYPHVNAKYGIYEGIYPQDVEKMWITSEKIQAIVITSPTYEGVVSDVEAICKLAHAHGVPVIVDEAHGAHFNFSEYFPASAVRCGADIVIQSTHKTLPAMTQTALIHMNGPLINRERIRRMLTIYQTSSPSYILMGSIDACMHMMKKNADVLFDTYVKNLQKLRMNIHRYRYIKMPEYEDFDNRYTYNYDRSKLVLSVAKTNMNGRRLHECLLHEFGLQMEMTSSDYVLAMTSVGDSSDGYLRLSQALSKIDEGLKYISENDNSEMQEVDGEIAAFPVTVSAMSIYEAGIREKDACYLENAEGCIAADYIYLYPPGIPLVTPGEIISSDVIKIIQYWLGKELHVTGIQKMNGAFIVKKIVV